MNAANTLATNIESIFNPYDGEDENEDEVSCREAAGSSLSDNSSNLIDAQAKVASLEQVVRDLQEALRQERERVLELTRILESHQIELPSFAAHSAAGMTIEGSHPAPREPAPSKPIKQASGEPLRLDQATNENVPYSSCKMDSNSEVSEGGWEQIIQ
ncbi:unnamed protein product [Phytomonas sp. Hart1]|nr:unnamed protein product [Phytomonas sp. Hart1]|eukprot:CCW70930.1 unnamed protein product [Phytomonas sp. isolate Hart1]